VLKFCATISSTWQRQTMFTEQLFCVQQRYSMSICRQDTWGIEPRATLLHYRIPATSLSLHNHVIWSVPDESNISALNPSGHTQIPIRRINWQAVVESNYYAFRYLETTQIPSGLLFGAAEGNRTLLSLADNELNSQSPTTALFGALAQNRTAFSDLQDQTSSINVSRA